MRIGILALQGAFLEHEQRLQQLGADCFEIRQLKDLEQGLDGLVLPGGESTVQRKLLQDLGLLEPLKEQIKNGLPTLATCAGLILLAEEIDSGEEPSHSKGPCPGEAPFPGEAHRGEEPSHSKSLPRLDKVSSRSSSPFLDEVSSRSNLPCHAEKPCHSEAPPRLEEPCFGTIPMIAKRNAYGRQLGSFHTQAEVQGIGSVPMTFIRAPYIASVKEPVQVLSVVNDNIVAVRYGNQIALAFHPELDADTRLHSYFLDLVAQ